MQKSHKVILLFFCIVTLISSSSFVFVSQNDTKTLRLGHSLDTGHAVHKALVYFQQQLTEVSSGKLKVTLYPSSQLGSERDMIELLQIGSLAMTKVSTGPLEAFEPAMKVFSLPYVFRNKAHVWQVLNSEIGQQLLTAPVSVGLRGLAYFDAGSRSFYTCNQPVYTPADLQGLKIRSMKSQTAVSLLNALGVSATPISFGELYSALQQGVVDGAENNAITFYKAKHFEVCKYYTLDEHNSIPDIILMSQKVWLTLSDQEKQWLKDAITKAVTYQKVLWENETQEALSAVQAAGVTVIYPDKTTFSDQVATYKSQFAGTPLGDLIKEIEAMQP